MLGVLAALNGLSRHRSLDRLIRGRTWIALIAFALIGIVTLQLLVLRLNASIGRALVHEAQLQRENAALSIESSELAAGERVESQAARLGMQLVPVGALRFLTIDPKTDIARAAAALSAPVQASTSDAGEAGTASSANTASSATTAAAGEQAAAAETTAPAAGESATSSAAATSATGETTAAASVQDATSAAGAASPTGEASAAAGAPGVAPAPGAGAAGGTEPTGTG